MDEFKEFQGKSLDEAIHNACVYFDVKREKLEIDIMQDAKGGFFGIVGVRPAIIRAKRMVSLRGSVGRELVNRQEPERPKTAAGHKESRADVQTAEVAESSPHEDPINQRAKLAPGSPRTNKMRSNAERQQRPNKSSDKAEGPAVVPSTRRKGDIEEKRGKKFLSEAPVGISSADQPREEESAGLLDALDKEELIKASEEAAKNLVEPILGSVPFQVSVSSGHVDVHVECGEQSGLLIGREGQPLSALLYLASRIVSTKMKAPVHVQFNAGNYRERQDERLKELALILAERVRTTGRSCSTRPMSSYHRRIVHIALQDCPDVQTRSSGEGAMKRVIVQKRKAS